MRRLAFLAAASLAFIAISEPISADGKDEHLRVRCVERCLRLKGELSCCEDYCYEQHIRGRGRDPQRRGKGGPCDPQRGGGRPL